MKLRSVMTVLAFTAAMPCVAEESVVITGFKQGYQSATIKNLSDTLGPYPAGEFVGLLNDKTFYTFCTDIYQNFSWNTSYKYELKSVADTQALWSPDGSTRPYAVGSYSQVSKLFTAAYGNIGSSSVNSAAFQFALWEVLYETKKENVPYDVSTGDFRLVGADAAQIQANAWLASLANVSEGYSVQSLYNDGRQDFLVATPVPEPQTYALALVSLGIVAGYARRKRDKA